MLAACGVGPWAFAADPGVAPPIAPEPADLAIAAALPHEDLAARTTALVHQGRWSDVVSICETAARKGTLAAALRHQYDLAKLHCDVARRHAEPAFRHQLASLSETDARRVYGEVLARIGSHQDRLASRRHARLRPAREPRNQVRRHRPRGTGVRGRPRRPGHARADGRLS